MTINIVIFNRSCVGSVLFKDSDQALSTNVVIILLSYGILHEFCTLPRICILIYFVMKFILIRKFCSCMFQLNCLTSQTGLSVSQAINRFQNSMSDKNLFYIKAY